MEEDEFEIAEEDVAVADDFLKNEAERDDADVDAETGFVAGFDAADEGDANVDNVDESGENDEADEDDNNEAEGDEADETDFRAILGAEVEIGAG